MKNHKNIKLSGGFLCISSPKSLGHLSSQGPEEQTNELTEAPEMSLWGMAKNDATHILFVGIPNGFIYLAVTYWAPTTFMFFVLFLGLEILK